MARRPGPPQRVCAGSRGAGARCDVQAFLVLRDAGEARVRIQIEQLSQRFERDVFLLRRSRARRSGSAPQSIRFQRGRRIFADLPAAQKSKHLKRGRAPAVRFWPGSNGQGPTLSSLSCNGRWKNAAIENFSPDSSVAARCRSVVVRRKSLAPRLRGPNASLCANSPCRGCVCGRRISDRSSSMSPKERYLARPLPGLPPSPFSFSRFHRRRWRRLRSWNLSESRDVARYGRVTAISSSLSKRSWATARRPRREGLSSGLLDVPHSLAQRSALSTVEQPGTMEDRAHMLHALSAAANDPPLSAGGASDRAFRFSCLVDQRRVETAHPGGDDASGLRHPPRQRPTRRRQCPGRCRGRACGKPSQKPFVTIEQWSALCNVNGGKSVGKPRQGGFARSLRRIIRSRETGCEIPT